MTERKLLFLMTAEQALAFARLVEAAESGDGAAACRLGDMWREGCGGLRFSARETFRWYARAALAGDPEGQNNLGACYEHGLGCRQSYKKAVEWYRRSAARGVGTASMNLGYCYLRGHGVGVDRAEALRLFRTAVEQGEPRAAEELERLGEPRAEPEPVTEDDFSFEDVTPSGGGFGLIGLGATGGAEQEAPARDPGTAEEGRRD